MKKKIWIMNHYAGDMFFNKGGRHYWFAKYLKRAGYEPVVFCCNAKHGERETFFRTNELYTVKNAEEIDVPFVYVKGRTYTGNGKQRILNMLDFWSNVKKAAKQYAKKHGKPDIILASSVHPLTILAGEQLAKKYKIPCIAEVRDLWPESIFAYYPEKKTKLLAKVLYSGEKKLYCDANAIVMTWPGGADYIQKMGWASAVNMTKVYHINNGVDLEAFEENKTSNKYQNDILSDKSSFRVVYTGAIRKVNNLGMLVQAANILQQRGNEQVKLLIWGAGDEKESLQAEIESLNLKNIVFMGSVSKQWIPSVLSQADCTIMHNSSTVLDCYGQSQNKFFEYLAAGKPILMTYSVGYSICKRKKCGLELEEQTPKQIADALEYMCRMQDEECREMSANAMRTAKEYDFKRHTEKLIEIIESV